MTIRFWRIVFSVTELAWINHLTAPGIWTPSLAYSYFCDSCHNFAKLFAGIRTIRWLDSRQFFWLNQDCVFKALQLVEFPLYNHNLKYRYWWLAAMVILGMILKGSMTVLVNSDYSCKGFLFGCEIKVLFHGQISQIWQYHDWTLEEYEIFHVFYAFWINLAGVADLAGSATRIRDPLPRVVFIKKCELIRYQSHLI